MTAIDCDGTQAPIKSPFEKDKQDRSLLRKRNVHTEMNDGAHSTGVMSETANMHDADFFQQLTP